MPTENPMPTEKRLLIVDDEPHLTRSFKILFEARKFCVHTASTGHDAVEIFKKTPFKVVLSDIKMNEMDGIELMHALKEMDPCVQVVFLTGYASIENAAHALKQNNAFEYLKKPVKHLNDLYDTIERAQARYDQMKNQLTRQKENEEGFAVFKSIFDSMEAIVYVSDMQSHEFIYANKKFMETFGDGQGVEGKKCFQVIQKGQTAPCSFCTNKRLIHLDGTPGEPYQWEFFNTLNQRWYSIVDKAITWYDNRIVRLETAFDITEKKEHEILFRKFEKAIETSKKLESIGTLAGGVAHDFNNTLSTIIGNINLAQLSCADIETQKFLKTAEKGVLQAKNISLKLITFARGGGPLKTRTNIEKLIQRVLEKKLDPKKITCSLEADKIPCDFYADQDQLETAFGNILINAIDSMNGQGRIDIAVRYLEKTLGNPRISISISDSGSGISPEHLDMVFNPYFTTKPLDSRKSTGLGLSIAWSIISRHGGNIHIESEKEQGTTVHIFLPVFNGNAWETGPEQDQDSGTSPVPGNTSARVLVMDDDELTLDVISQLLRRLGYETRLAVNGNQALDICRAGITCGKKIDIALLDYDVMGSLDGFQTMDQLKKTDPFIRGILITGHSDNTEIRKFWQHGFSDMLEKPFSVRELNEKIRHLLG